MSVIQITDLQPAGSALFSDSESFLNSLTEDEMGIGGGWWRRRPGYSYSHANFGFSVGRGRSYSFNGFSISRGRGYSYRFF